MSNDQKLTCATCKNIQRRYWGDEWAPIHFCAKSNARRQDSFQSSGDFSTDFMNEFRKFYDAAPLYAACRYYEVAPPLDAQTLALLGKFDADGRAAFAFFSDENSAAHKLEGIFLERDSHRDLRHGEVRAYKISMLGRLRLEKARVLETIDAR